jgi:hypothetical protein
MNWNINNIFPINKIIIKYNCQIITQMKII